MSKKGIAIQGRDPLGNAKYVNVDEEGYVLVRQPIDTETNLTEQLISREIRTTNASTASLVFPSGYKGFLILLKMYGVTGVFNGNEGARVRIETFDTSYITANLILDANILTSRATSNRSQLICLYPGISDTPLTNAPNVLDYILMTSPRLGSKYKVTLTISGTFSAGQGIDCEVLMYHLR